MTDPNSGGKADAFAPTPSRDLLFTVSLAGLAGFNDGVTFTVFGSYVSSMSGNVTEVGSMTGFNAALVDAALLALVSFTLGAMLGDYLVDAADDWGRTIVIVGEALAIIVAAIVASMGGGKMPLLSILALAMGIQNSALHRHSGLSVAVTGTIARLGRVLGHVLKGKDSLFPRSAAGAASPFLALGRLLRRFRGPRRRRHRAVGLRRARPLPPRLEHHGHGPSAKTPRVLVLAGESRHGAAARRRA